jgi:hypothetical protein
MTTRLKLIIDEYIVDIYTTDSGAAKALVEAKLSGIPLGGPYSAKLHQAHTTPGEKHVHVFCKGNELFALNLGSGTAHNHSHGIRIPNKVAIGLKSVFPNIVLPPNNIIESVSPFDELRILTESDQQE